MSASEERLRKLVREAPKSEDHLFRLLVEGLDWPVPEDTRWEDIAIDWRPEDLHLDPEKLAKLRRISLVPPFTAKQDFGVFMLRFDGSHLPVAAVRRLVERLVDNRRSRAGKGTTPTWQLSDLLFFCLSESNSLVLHVVALRERDDKRQVQVMTWDAKSSETRVDLLMQRDLLQLQWGPDDKPRIAQGVDGVPGFGQYRGTIKGAKALAAHMAATAQNLRAELMDLYEVELDDGPIRSLFAEFQRELIGDLTPEKFADIFAQTMVYGLLSARITHPERFNAYAALDIQFDNPLLNALYGRFRDDMASGVDLDSLGLADLAADLASPDLDVERMLADFGTGNRREDPVVHFYEEFLNHYDHAQRIDAGAFYTPGPVVEFMVAAVDDILRDRFGLELGIADGATWAEVAARNGFEVPKSINPKKQFVSMIDPATGTGTFLVEWIRRAKQSYLAKRPASGWPEHFRAVVMPSMHAFELMLAPYAVAHLKVALEAHESADVDPEIAILLTDSLEFPDEESIFDFKDDPLTAEGERAAQLKLHERFTICVGNPPYDREQKAGGAETAHRKGGVVRYGVGQMAPLLDDVLAAMKTAGLGKHAKNLYNDYVYFWRWAMWRTTQRPQGPGVTAFITASSFLAGVSMAGLRHVMRAQFDEIFIVDLGGDSLGANPEENVFDIRVPVAVAVCVNTGSQSKSCKVRYTRVGGTRSEKYEWLHKNTLSAFSKSLVAGEGLSVFTPTSEDSYWEYPELTQLMPWAHSGSQLKRKWPIAVTTGELERRWIVLSEMRGDTQRSAFRETGFRGVQVPGVDLITGRKLRALDQDGAMLNPEGYGYRSFDRQWTLPDSRVSDRPRPELWATSGPNQIFLGTMTSTKLGVGPAAVVSEFVPDLHFFSGRGARDVLPLWRDRQATQPNMSAGMLEALSQVLGPLGAEDLFAYIYGLSGTSAFTCTFHAPLSEQAGPIRIPITKSRELFAHVAAFGRDLIWWHTFGERVGDGAIPLSVHELAPVTGRPDKFKYDAIAEELVVGTGRVGPIRPDVYEFEVSGLKVLQSWLGHRTAAGKGKKSSPLDDIRYEEWCFTEELLRLASILHHTVEVTPRAQELLDRVLAGDVFLTSELPQPTGTEQKAPR